MITAGAAERDAVTNRGRAGGAWLILGPGIMHAYTAFQLAFIAEFGRGSKAIQR